MALISDDIQFSICYHINMEKYKQDEQIEKGEVIGDQSEKTKEEIPSEAVGESGKEADLLIAQKEEYANKDAAAIEQVRKSLGMNMQENQVNVEQAPESLFDGLERDHLMRVRQAIDDNPKLTSYYDLVKNKLITESGLPTVNRRKILTQVHELLSSGGVVERGLAKKLEAIVLETDTQ